MTSSAHTQNSLTPSPWTAGNTVELLPNGDIFYPRILSAIASAQSTIELEMYLVESGKVASRFVDALCLAARRQVTVRILLDHVGSIDFDTNDQLHLKKAGVNIRFYNRLHRDKMLKNLARDHRKIVIIDGQQVYVGGAGITDEFDPNTATFNAWRELMLEIHGPTTNHWKLLFEHAWATYKGPYQIDNWREKVKRYKAPVVDPLSINRSIPLARINGSRGFGRTPINKALLRQLRSATERVWLSTAYFYPSRPLRQALKNASLRGVDVRLLLPGSITDHPSVRYAGQSYYQTLLDHNVKIYEYQPGFLHMKLVLIDDWCTIGSCNFDRWNLRWNLEANQEIVDPVVANNVATMLLEDYEQCNQLDPQIWKCRSSLQRAREFFWSKVGVLMVKTFIQ